MLACFVGLLMCDTAVAQVKYRGAVYNSRVCNSPYCTMCNRIEAGLAAQRQSTVASLPIMQPQYQTVPVLSSSAYSTSYSVAMPVVVPGPSVTSLAVDLTLEPTPQAAVEEMMKLIQPQESDTLVDLGCGDGRILIAAASRGARAVGVELNKSSCDLAVKNVADAGVGSRVRVVHGDARKAADYGASIVTMYLFPDLMQEVWQRIRPGVLVVSYSHPLPVDYAASKETASGTFYFTIKRRD